MSDERKRIATLWIAGVALVLLGSYTGAYFAMVRPAELGIGIVEPLYPVDISRIPSTSAPGKSDWVIWSTNSPTCDAIFAPIHWIDRRIRPHVWEPTP